MDEPKIVRALGVVRRTRRSLSPAGQAFVEVLQAMAAVPGKARGRARRGGEGGSRVAARTR